MGDRAMSRTAVIFDLGGVVFDSPMEAFWAAERRCGLERNFLNRMIVANGHEGAWSRLERGELSLGPDFFQIFDEEIAAAGAPNVSSAAIMQEIAEKGGVRPLMLEAIRRLRAADFRVAALTNNWVNDEAPDANDQIRDHFDAFIESAVVGIRKPDPRIYQLACEALSVDPTEAVFLDDIGRNLKAARALGMATIKVEAPDAALAELEAIVGIPLLA
jgi:putative hydrolase of the HAD superfamily